MSESVHYVVSRGSLSCGKDPDNPRKRLVWSEGKVLPPEIGREEALASPHCIEIRPGHRDPDPPDEGVASSEANPAIPKRQEGTLNETDLAALAALLKAEERKTASRAAAHDQAVGPEQVAAREAVARKKPGPKPKPKTIETPIGA